MPRRPLISAVSRHRRTGFCRLSSHSLVPPQSTSLNKLPITPSDVDPSAPFARKRAEQRDILMARMTPQQRVAWEEEFERVKSAARIVDMKPDHELSEDELHLKHGNERYDGPPLPGEEEFHMVDKLGRPTARCRLVNPQYAAYLDSNPMVVTYVPESLSEDFCRATGGSRLPDLPADYDPLSNPETFTYTLPPMRAGEAPERVVASFATKDPESSEEAHTLNYLRSLAAAANEPVPGAPSGGLADSITLFQRGGQGRVVGRTASVKNPVAEERKAALKGRSAQNYVRSGVVCPEALYGETPSLDKEKDSARMSGAHYWSTLQAADPDYVRVSDEKVSRVQSGLVDDETEGPGVSFVDPASIVVDASLLPPMASVVVHDRSREVAVAEQGVEAVGADASPSGVAAAARRAARESEDASELAKRRDGMMRDSFRATMSDLMREDVEVADSALRSSSVKPKAASEGSADYASFDRTAARTALPDLDHEDTAILASVAFRHVAKEWLKASLTPWKFRCVKLYAVPFESFSALSAHVVDAVVACARPQTLLHHGSADFAYKMKEAIERLSEAKKADFPAMRYLRRRVPPSLLRELDANAASAAAYRGHKDARAAAAQNGMLLHIPFWLATDVYGGHPLVAGLQRYHHLLMNNARVFALDPTDPPLPGSPLDTDALYETYQSGGLSALFDLSAPNGAASLAGAVDEINRRFDSLKSLGLPMAAAATPSHVREGMLTLAIMLQMLSPEQLGPFMSEVEWTSPALYDFWVGDAKRNVRQIVRYLRMQFADDDPTTTVALLPAYAFPHFESEMLSLGAVRAGAPDVPSSAILPKGLRPELESVVGEEALNRIASYEPPTPTLSSPRRHHQPDLLRASPLDRSAALQHERTVVGGDDTMGAAFKRSDLKDFERERLEKKQRKALDPTAGLLSRV